MIPAIVVTGASSGIGREIARVAVREGARMLLVGRAEGALKDLAAELRAGGAEAEPLVVDLGLPDAGERVEAALAERALYCDVLVNSAGFGMWGRAADIGRREQLNLLDVNARALTDLSLRFLPGMIARRRGGILNVGSTAGYTPGPYMAAYYASKAYVRSFSLALAAEAAGTGVTITCLTPGFVRTAFFERCSVFTTRLFKVLPRSTALEVAEAAWGGLRAGKIFVVPRVKDRIFIAFCKLLPDMLLLRLIARLQRPATTGGAPHSAEDRNGTPARAK
jgi:uncharacterized protein